MREGNPSISLFTLHVRADYSFALFVTSLFSSFTHDDDATYYSPNINIDFDVKCFDKYLSHVACELESVNSASFEDYLASYDPE